MNAKNIKTPIDFMAKIHSYLDIPRIDVESIANDVNQLFDNIINDVEKQVMQVIASATNKNQIIESLKPIFQKNQNQFSEINTEHRCLTHFTRLGTYIPPVEYVLCERREFVHVDNVKVLQMMKVTALFIPIRHVFKKFFELPGIFYETMNYMDSLLSDDDMISNFIQGNRWNETVTHFVGKIVLPVFLYFDDYEVNNPLGSHKGISKCGALYLSIPCLPPTLASKLEKIFLFVLFNTLDREVFKNPIIFSKVIDELEFLESKGIVIRLANQEKTIYFKLALVLGDNLGLHSILGFSEGFSGNSFCRFCHIKKNDRNNIFDEGECSLQTKENYDNDILKHDSTQTGIVNECIFHKIPHFHVTKNLSVDVMHDLLEGVCQYDMGLILHKLIKVSELFPLDEVNLRIKGMDYGRSKNIPPEILDSHIKQKRLKMSASEMLTFVRYFQYIFCSIIPNDNDVWDLYEELRDIVELTASENVHKDCVPQLRLKVAEYLQLLNNLFLGSIKPKHHFLIHYARVLLESGPIWKMCSMRFESKHREGKIVARAAVSRVNVCHTVAIKHQLRLNYQLLFSKEILAFIYDPSLMKMAPMKTLSDVEFFKQLINVDIQDDEVIGTVKKVLFERQIISPGTLIMIPSEDGPIFYNVKHILKYNAFLFVCHVFFDVYATEDISSYEIMSDSCSWAVLNYDDFAGFTQTHIVRTTDGRRHFVKKWY